MALSELSVEFIDNAGIQARKDGFTTMTVAIEAVLKSWQKSLFAFEWLNEDGSIKKIDELAVLQRDKRLEIELLLNDGKPLPRPVLGIGMLDTVEIGAGKEVILTLGAHGFQSVPVHVPTGNIEDFQSFAA